MQAASIDAPLTGFLTNASLASGMTTHRRAVDRRLAQRQARARGRGADWHRRASRRRPADGAERDLRDAPAIEIVELGDPGDIEQVLAENMFHRAFLFGPFSDADGTDLAAVRLSVSQDGGEPQAGIDPATVLGDLVEVVRAVADQAPLADDVLRAGDVVMTGSVLPAIAIVGGERFEVTLPGAGSVTLQIAPAAGTG